MSKKIINNDNNFEDNPYYIVGDEEYPLLINLMRPYPGRGTSKLPLKESIFNYRYMIPFYKFLIKNILYTC